MYCYATYHPASFQVAEFYLSVTRKYCFPTSFDDLRDPAAKDNSMTHAGAVPSNLDAAITMRSAEAELQNTIELRATASEIAAPKPEGARRHNNNYTILQHFLQGF